MKNIFYIFFPLISIGEIASHIFRSEILHFACKPLLLIFISVYFYSETKSNYSLFAKLMQTGFFFSWIGDVLLMFEGEKFFLLGLFSFLLTHLFYISAFLNSAKGKKSFLKKYPAIIIPFAIIVSVILYVLFPNLNELAIPVTIYATTIMVMVLSALNLKYAIPEKSFWMIFPGAVLFMTSDSAISITKFISPFVYSEVFIMATYISAQYLILRGSIKFNC